MRKLLKRIKKLENKESLSLSETTELERLYHELEKLDSKIYRK